MTMAHVLVVSTFIRSVLTLKTNPNAIFSALSWEMPGLRRAYLARSFIPGYLVMKVDILQCRMQDYSHWCLLLHQCGTKDAGLADEFHK